MWNMRLRGNVCTLQTAGPGDTSPTCCLGKSRKHMCVPNMQSWRSILSIRGGRQHLAVAGGRGEASRNKTASSPARLLLLGRVRPRADDVEVNGECRSAGCPSPAPYSLWGSPGSSYKVLVCGSGNCLALSCLVYLLSSTRTLANLKCITAPGDIVE